MVIARLKAAAWPMAGFAVTYVLFQIAPWGRNFDLLSVHGRQGAGWRVRIADRLLLETISVATIAVVLLVVLVVAARRGRGREGMWSAGAVVGAILSVEILKPLLPGTAGRTGEWRWLTSQGSFPSGHSVIAAALTLAVLSVVSDRWRPVLVGPMLAWTAVAAAATVTLGWHRPSDVLGSFFLATAWHRACTCGRPAQRRLRAMLPSTTAARERLSVAGVPAVPAVLWWGLACLLVLGAGVHGVLRGESVGHVPALAYLTSLTLVLAGAGLTVAAMRPTPVRVNPRRASVAG
jgi:membrane-associated phospholipid phosphatase